MVLNMSCSFKKPEDSKNQAPSEKDQLSINSGLDSDGDGILDSLEIQVGSDPFIADIPNFEGDFFQEMKVHLELYNRANKTIEKIGWAIKDGRIKLSWEKDERRSLWGGLYMESILKNYAVNSDFKKNNFKFHDYNEGLFSNSSPVFYEDTLFSISNQLINYLRSGHSINRVEVLIKNKFKINYKKYAFYKNPVFDIYYKSKKREGLIFIESKRIDGTYSFNEDNEIFLQFDNSDEAIINDAILSEFLYNR